MLFSAKRCLALLLGLLLIPPASADENLRVAVSIKPIHSLVAGIVGDIGAVDLVLTAGQSPHHLSLRPSQLRMLSEADLLVVSDRQLEQPLVAIAKSNNTPLLVMSELADALVLPARNVGVFGQGAHRDVRKLDSTGKDPHLWLSPGNASLLGHAVARWLGEFDPKNSQAFISRANLQSASIESLSLELADALAPVRDKSFIVFHDAWQYFEQAFSLRVAGAVAVDAGRGVSAKRLSQLKAHIIKERAGCIFTEPQFSPELAKILAQETGIGIAQLDPVGSRLTPGPELWFSLMRNIADSIQRCQVDN